MKPTMIGILLCTALADSNKVDNTRCVFIPQDNKQSQNTIYCNVEPYHEKGVTHERDVKKAVDVHYYDPVKDKCSTQIVKNLSGSKPFKSIKECEIDVCLIRKIE